MNLGKNLQYLRMLHNNMTQEELANLLRVSRQTVSKWELSQVNPEISKVKEICTLFSCSADELLFGNINIQSEAYSEITIEMIDAFRYIRYTVISQDPEDDAIYRIKKMATKFGIEAPEIIGWDFSHLSQEQINVYHMHGYTAALIIPSEVEINKSGMQSETIEKREKQNYVTLTIKNPMDAPFVLIGNAYKSAFQYIKVNGYTYDHFAFEHQFYEDEVEYIKICVAIQ